MPSSSFCLKCGAKLAKDAKICDNCKNSTSKTPDPLNIELKDISWKSCFNCDSKNLIPLIFLYHQGIPPGRKGHNVAYAHYIIITCLDCGAGFIEKRDHDCWSYDEVWDQNEWYILNSSNIKNIRKMLEDCPNPLSSLCMCPFHNILRSEIYSLPTNPWESVSKNLKHIPKFKKKHIHYITLNIKDGLPKFELNKQEN